MTSPSLNETQRDFTNCLLDHQQPVPPGIGAPNGSSAEKRFSIYRNNVVMSLTDVLTAYFPVVVRLLGEEYFYALAREFVLAHPPVTPVLTQYGARFAGFISSFPPITDLPYLADVTRLEWLRQRAYHAADGDALGAADFKNVAPSNVPRLCFRFHPSVGLLRSKFPVFDIWRTNTFDKHIRTIPATAPGQAVLISRVGMSVRTLSIEPGTHAFIIALEKGENLASAAQRAFTVADEFNLQIATAVLINMGAITAITEGGPR